MKALEWGKVLMPLDTYDWSVKYAWVEDKYGVSWQLDIDAINNVQSIVPAFYLRMRNNQEWLRL